MSLPEPTTTACNWGNTDNIRIWHNVIAPGNRKQPAKPDLVQDSIGQLEIKQYL